ncbi:putative hydrolase of the HAD superfamily [Devosia sp. YR412]|uniref:pyrimidine 5'-nucleotidase n=1 Tax=Devosia sp. YR412 TaxID=1881030 RepID=UPI0008B26710|nr:pyrimidine 5'-nucleotidase [Devosia sp. YR412]SEP67760.1 putative hydrolase of the HAD superfamily [Devosia sp. YR412]
MNHMSPPRSLSHITDWVFDLDNTLYPRSCNLFAQIDIRITNYVMDLTKLDFDAARALQKTYYRDFGTTLNGLMTQHTVDPDDFLNSVHAIDYAPVDPHPDLVDAIRALPGRKFILTNGDVGHARSVLKRLGGDDLFEHVHDIRAMTYVPKPHKAAYDGFFALHSIDPTRAVMFDDLEKNLVVPHDMGMSTVQVVAGPDFVHEQVDAWELDRAAGPHVHHITDDLAKFLRERP